MTSDFESNREYFLDNILDIRKRYGDQLYVAICDEREVGFGTNEDDLFKRLEMRYGSKIYIRRVKDFLQYLGKGKDSVDKVGTHYEGAD
ncbi:MAG: hypothetical protein Q7S27_03550 [Nanoarchaeota archaeon]|nr:hypothetical protein [Nanoarchaeota archaeon]